MYDPFSVASDGTSLYVTDGANNRVLVWKAFPTAPVSADFALGQPVGGFNLLSSLPNTGGVTGAAMSYPQGVAVVGTQLYVADTGNNRVLVWNVLPTSPVAADFALGQPNLTSNATNNGGVSAASMDSPIGISGGNGQLFVADWRNSRVLVWSTAPTSTQSASFVLGQPNATSNTFDNGGISASSMGSPTNAAVANGKLVVSDTSNYRLLVWNQVPSSAVGADYAIGVPAGATNLTSAVYDDGVATTGGTFNLAAGIYGDGTHLFAADINGNRVLGWATMPAQGQPADFALGQAAGSDNLTTMVTAGGASGMHSPSGGVFVQNGSLFVADSFNNRVLVWSTVPTSAQPADFALGQPAGATNLTSTGIDQGGISGSAMGRPIDIWGDGTRLFVADSLNNRVLVWNTTPTTPVPADFALGQPGLTTNTANNGGPATGLAVPKGVFGMGGALYVTDSVNNRVLVWKTTPTSSTPPDFALGQPNLTTTTAGRTQNSMGVPSAITGDGTRLYVADTGNNRVLVWASAPASAPSAPTSVIGAPDFTSNGLWTATSLTATVFDQPTGLFTDGARLFVADQYNNRIVVLPQ